MIKEIKINELDRVMEIIADAIELLSINSTQWQQGYPNKETLSNDIKNNNLYGYYIDNLLVGIIAFVPGINKDYLKIDGKWEYPTGTKDFTIHRIAVKKEYYHKGIGDSLIKYSIEYAKECNYKSIKIDTTSINIRMKTIIDNNNFKYRGIIKLVRNEIDPYRDAYEYNL